MLPRLFPNAWFQEARRPQGLRRIDTLRRLAVSLLFLLVTPTSTLAEPRPPHGGPKPPGAKLGVLDASTTSVNFGSMQTGATATQQVVLTNVGSAGVSISQFACAGAGFEVSAPGVPLSLSVGQSVSVTVSFSPSAAGNYSGTLTVSSNASNSPAIVTLSGTGMSLQLSASPTNVSFGDVVVGSTSTQSVSFANTGGGAVTISQASVAGTGFSLSGLLSPLTLSPGQSVSASVTFTPSAAGSLTGSISVVSNASNSPMTVALSGTGTALQLSASPTNLSFGDVTVGTNSVLPVVVTNTGNQSVTISQVSLVGAGFSASGITLPATLAPSQNATLSITFAPTSAGSVTGSVSVVSNAGNSPTVTALSGTGANTHSVSLSWVASTSSGVTGYNVYRGAVSTGPYTKINSAEVTVTSYSDTTVQAGETYYYVTTALDSTGGESAYSNSAEAVVPSP